MGQVVIINDHENRIAAEVFVEYWLDTDFFFSIYRQDISIVSRVVSCSLFPEVPGVLTHKVTIKLKSIKV